MDKLLEVKDLKKYFPIKGGFFGRTVAEVKAVDGVSSPSSGAGCWAWWGSPAAENPPPAG